MYGSTTGSYLIGTTNVVVRDEKGKETIYEPKVRTESRYREGADQF